MATHRTGNDPNSKPSKYRSLVPLGGAGVVMIAVGFIIGWVWLVWLGFILFLAAAFLTKLWFFGDWIPTLLAAKEREHEDSWRLPPPPTLE